MTKAYDELPFIARLLLQIFLGAIVGGIYRIFKYLDSKNSMTLVGGILALIPPISFIFWVLDLVTLCTEGRMKVLAD